MAPARERILEWVQLACLAWIVWLPVSTGMVLYPALLLVAATSLLLVVWRRTRPTRAAVVVWGVYYLWAVTWTAVSAARGNEGVWHQAALWLGLPLLWGTWSLSLRSAQVRRTIVVLLGVGCVAGTLMLLLALQGVTGSPTFPAWLVELQDMRVVVSGTGEIEQNYLGLSSLVGVATFAVAAAVLPSSDTWLPHRAVVAPAAAVMFAAASVSGRRGLLLVVLLVLVTALLVGVGLLLVQHRTFKHLSSYAAGVAVAAAVVVAFAATPLGQNLQILAGIDAGTAPAGTASDGAGAEDFDSLQAESDQLRSAQFTELIDAWREQPLVGHGFGATLDSDFTRSDERPWMFEAEPLQALMNVGILGLLVAAGPVVLLLRRSWQALATGLHPRAVIAGLATLFAVVLASATNPYLQAPGHGWMLFLAAGITGAALHERRAPSPDATD
ncbi:O-antigen ligase family protein [Nocardioides lacusdianchii]|uniref:O-antigen ligase family protein n=1 Tax=Nocardioides lacusdianchii TaxID=2783664 RepID=UPI001CC9F5C6|nr:O-antigen ligase family protein [Nocardioides lacusdianchii]